MDEDKKKIVVHKISIIQNDIKIMKDTMFDLKMEMNEIKNLIRQIILENENKKPEISKGWFWG